MKFTYSVLKNAACNGDRVGNWKGYPVFACERESLDRKSEGVYFIVYNDDNYIVRRIGNQWYSYGRVREDGSVTEWDYKKKYECDTTQFAKYEVKYCYDTQAYEPAANVCGKQGECDAAHEVVVGDVKLGLDVDATLKAAREMTVNSLLEGFNYGL